MSFGLRMRKTPKPEIEKLVEEASQILSIEPLLDRRPRELSGGQRQRVAVGRAIVRKPKAFLFDEPLSNLDAKLRVQMRTELARLHHRLKTTTVYVTHDQVEAMTLGDRIVVMKDGEIQQVDSPLEIYRHPVNRFVAGFIGSPAMNFVEGVVRGGVFSADGIEYPLGGTDFRRQRVSRFSTGARDFGCQSSGLVKRDPGSCRTDGPRDDCLFPAGKSIDGGEAGGRRRMPDPGIKSRCIYRATVGTCLRRAENNSVSFDSRWRA